MASTLLLDRSSWDLALDAAGDIAVATEPYSREQDVASECRVVKGEAWYDTTLGIPYLTSILGQPIPVQILKENLITAAKRVPGVTNVKVFLSDISGRTVSGQVQFDGGVAKI